MFEDQNQKVEDIFSATDKAPVAPTMAPMAPIAPIAQTPPVAPNPINPTATPPLGPPTALSQGRLQPANTMAAPLAPAQQLSGSTGLSSAAKKMILVVVIIVLLGGATLAGLWWWKSKKNSGGVDIPKIDNPISAGKEAIENQVKDLQEQAIQKALNPLDGTTAEAVSTSTTTQDTGATPSDASSTIAPVDSKTDTDLDGLSDQEEAQLSTNPRLVDTDNDMLTDWEEIKVWNTNPLIQDTDGDKYNDGQEVQNGYNPAGEGKLSESQKAQSGANQ